MYLNALFNPMKIVIAPDSYKESLSAPKVAEAILEGFKPHFLEANFIVTPLSDGGEGMIAALKSNLSGSTLVPRQVTNPLGKKIKASFLILKDKKTAVIEMAEASGLRLVSINKRDPLKTTSFGTGELIRCALDQGCRKFIIGLGGSATCDGGIGALTALGVIFKHKSENLKFPFASDLLRISSVNTKRMDPRLLDAEFILAHDVINPLLGIKGALLYAPQKGASIKQLDFLNRAFEHYNLILSKIAKKNIGNIPGTGSAGGLAAGLYTFLNAKLKPGSSVFMEKINFRQKIRNANLIITGEGQIDFQTIFGKTPCSVASIAKEFNIPVIAIAARLGPGYHEVYRQGIDAVFSITNGPLSKTQALKQCRPLLIDAASNIARLFKLGESTNHG